MLDTAVTTATIARLPATSAAQLLLDQVQWMRSVQLAVGTEGALFEGAAGNWRYQLGDLADGQAVYDVTDPAQPEEIRLKAAALAPGRRSTAIS